MCDYSTWPIHNHSHANNGRFAVARHQSAQDTKESFYACSEVAPLDGTAEVASPESEATHSRFLATAR